MTQYIEIERYLEELIEEGKYNEAISIANWEINQSKDRNLMALLLYEKGKALYFSGDQMGAMESIKQAHSLVDDMEESDSKYEMLFHIAGLYLMAGDMENSKRMYHTVLGNLPENNHFYLASLHNIGEIYKREDDLKNAEKYFTRCYNLSVKHGDNFMAAYSAENLAELYAVKGDRKKSEEWLKIALPLSRKAGENRLVPLIDLALRMLKGEKNEYILERVEEIKRLGTHHAHDMADMLLIFSVLLKREDAIKYVKEAILIYSEIGDGYMEKKGIEYLETLEKEGK